MKLLQIPSLRSIARLLLVCATLALLAGCASGPPPVTRGKPVPWTIKLTKSTADLVEVDLFGVNKLEDDHWRNRVRMDDYCRPNSDLRAAVLQDRAKTTRFDGPGTFVLEVTDPKWKSWLDNSCYELAIMANLPGAFPNPAADGRRLFLPLGKKEWGAKVLEVEILRDGLHVKTPPKP